VSAPAVTETAATARRAGTPGSAAPATPYREAARELLRDSLFDAARRLLDDRPWAQISMAEVARAAGVSRQTLYAQFGSRDEFAQQFVIREGARFLDEVERAIHAHLDDPVGAVSAAMQAFLASAAADPLVRLLLSDDGTGGMLPLVTTRSRPVLDWASARLCAAMREGWPAVGAADAEVLADTLVRLALSYVTLAPDRDPAGTADAAARLLGPYVERALDRVGGR
jgi:AcrR family transcriptional regulator